MKKEPFFQLAFYLILISILALFACGDPEGTQDRIIDPASDNTDPAYDDPTAELNAQMARVTSLYAQFQAKELKVPRNPETHKDLALRAAAVRYELSSGKQAIPPQWLHTEDPVLRAEYFRAELVKQYGDIPQVQIISDDSLKHAIGWTLGIRWYVGAPGEDVAYLEALYDLWPDETLRRLLEEAREHANAPTYNELQEQDPELWARLERENLIEKYGDRPETHVMADFHKKVAFGLETTDAEYLAYLEAVAVLNPDDEIGKRLLERFRAAKAAGIPFSEVDTDDIVIPNGEAAGD